MPDSPSRPGRPSNDLLLGHQALGLLVLARAAAQHLEVSLALLARARGAGAGKPPPPAVEARRLGRALVGWRRAAECLARLERRAGRLLAAARGGPPRRQRRRQRKWPRRNGPGW
jgi:hypothetical protein